MPETKEAQVKSPLQELSLLFLRLGITAFGGPAAHIAMMEHEVVRRRQWLSKEEFLDLLGATNLIPGPNSTEMAIHIGFRRGGWKGLILAGACFILPAALIVTAIAWMYLRYGKLPEGAAVLYGIKPVIIAIVFQALWRLGNTALKTPLLIIAACGSALASFLGTNELIVLFGTGILVAILQLNFQRQTKIFDGTAPMLAIASPVIASTIATPVAAGFSLQGLFLFFLKVGSVLFGSGYVLLAFLRADLVERWGWLSESQLLDAIAVGQLTPGPVFTTATFIGYILGGGIGATLATVGIFLPAFFFVALSARFVMKLRKSRVAAGLLDGVNVASLALMAVVTLQISQSALVDPLTVGLAFATAIVLFRFQVNSAWLVLAGAGAGLIRFGIK